VRVATRASFSFRVAAGRAGCWTGWAAGEGVITAGERFGTWIMSKNNIANSQTTSTGKGEKKQVGERDLLSILSDNRDSIWILDEEGGEEGEKEVRVSSQVSNNINREKRKEEGGERDLQAVHQQQQGFDLDVG